eukprot:403343406
MKLLTLTVSLGLLSLSALAQEYKTFSAVCDSYRPFYFRGCSTDESCYYSDEFCSFVEGICIIQDSLYYTNPCNWNWDNSEGWQFTDFMIPQPFACDSEGSLAKCADVQCPIDFSCCNGYCYAPHPWNGSGSA